MDRKYLAKAHDVDDDTTDPLDHTKRKFQFQKQPFSGESENLSLKQESNGNTGRQNKQSTFQETKEIDSVSLRKARLSENLKFLQGESDFVKKNEFATIGREFESDKIGQEVTGLLYQYEKQKIAMTQRQIQEERALVEDLNQKVEQNIAKFVNLESRLKHKQEELEVEVRVKSQKLVESERLAAIGELSSRLAHDLKNPLSAVKGTAQLIKATNKNLDELTLKRIEIIERAIFRMTHQIDGVLDYVKGTPLVKNQPSSLNETIISALQTLLIPTNITINFPKDDIIILCDSHKMQIVFSNMILNSIQSIGATKGTINIRTKKRQNHVEVRIEDSGPGIADQIFDKIFDPLFTTKQEGTGLGLASCKNIIEQHGGTISASNKPTTFIISLPA